MNQSKISPARQWLLSSLIASTSLAGTALAQVKTDPPSLRRQYHRPPAVTPANADSAPPADSLAQSLLQAKAGELENAVAQLLQKKADTTGDAAVFLNLEIDFRLLARAAYTVAAEAKPNSPEQANAVIRAQVLANTVAALDDWLRQGVSVSPDQLQAIKTLHDLSFKLDQLKTNGDGICRDIGVQLAVATGTLPAGGRFPSVRPDAARPATAPSPPAGHRVVSANSNAADVNTAIRLLAVSVPLRHQLLALADQATAENDPNGPVFHMLRDGVAIAQGLQSNTGVGQDDREEIEKQLTEGLALFSDVRTRDAGQARLDSLSQYRQLLTRVGRMNLSPELIQRLSPAFSWARQNPAPGGKLLGEIERFTQLSAAHDSHAGDGELPGTLRRAADQLNKRFSTASEDFLSQAISVGQGGVLGAVPPDLQPALDQMRNAQDLLELLPKLPADLKTLAAYHPRPATGLDRQVNLAANSFTAVTSTGGDAAASLFRGIHRLATVANDMAAAPAISTIPPAVVSAYGGPAAGTFETKWRSLVTDLASGVAANGTLDENRMKGLFSAGKLRDALRATVDLNTAFAKLSQLEGWLDWAITGEQLDALLGTYQQAMIAAFSAFDVDDTAKVDNFLRLHRRYHPVLAELVSASALANSFHPPAAGLLRCATDLNTPLDNQPYGGERLFSLQIWLYSQSIESLPQASDAILDDLSKHLAEAGVRQE